MTNTQRDELLLKMDQKLSDVQQDVSILKQDVSGLKQKVSILEQDVSTLKQDMSEQKAYTKRISESVAFIEVDHGDKLQSLLDMYPEFTHKFESNKKRFSSQEKRLENHTFRILRIENKIGIK